MMRFSLAATCIAISLLGTACSSAEEGVNEGVGEANGTRETALGSPDAGTKTGKAIDLVMSKPCGKTGKEVFDELVEGFTQAIAEKCIEESKEAKSCGSGKDPAACLSTSTLTTIPKEIKVGVYASASSSEYKVSVKVSWAWGSKGAGSTSICYHPSYTPAVMAFRSELRASPMFFSRWDKPLCL